MMYSIIEVVNEKMMFSPLYGNCDIHVKVIRKIMQNGNVIGIQAIDNDGYEVARSAERFHY